MRRGKPVEDDPSTMIAGILAAIFFLWLGTSLLLAVVPRDAPWARPSAWLIALALYGVAGLFIRDLMRRWRRGERIGFRPSGPVLASVELAIGLVLLGGSLIPVALGDFRATDLIGLCGGLILTTSAVIGFLALARRRVLR